MKPWRTMGLWVDSSTQMSGWRCFRSWLNRGKVGAPVKPASRMSACNYIVGVEPRVEGPVDMSEEFGQVNKSVPPTDFHDVFVAGILFWLDDLGKPDITGFNVINE